MQGRNRTRSPAPPLLLNFVRPQPAREVDYRYDETQRLNIITATRAAVVTSSGGKAIVKTQAVAGED